MFEVFLIATNLPSGQAKRCYITHDFMVDWLVVLGFNATLTAKVMAVGDAYVFPGFLTPVAYQHNFSFQSHRLLFLHAFAEMRGENTPERKVASTTRSRDRHAHH